MGLLATCNDSWNICDHPPESGFKSTLVRLHCPVTCGCGQPGQFFIGKREGCPTTCSARRQDALAGAFNCSDYSPNELRHDLPFQRYMFAVLRYMLQFQNTGHVHIARRLNTSVRESGCGAFAKPYKLDVFREGVYDTSLGGLDFCDQSSLAHAFEGSRHMTVRPWCPVTCKCGMHCQEHRRCVEKGEHQCYSACMDCP